VPLLATTSSRSQCSKVSLSISSAVASPNFSIEGSIPSLHFHLVLRKVWRFSIIARNPNVEIAIPMNQEVASVASRLGDVQDA